MHPHKHKVEALPDSPAQSLQNDCVQLIEALPAAIYTCDLEGRITFCNEAAIKLWGRAPVLGKDLWCGSLKMYKPDGQPLSIEECPMAITLRERRAVVGFEM